MNAFCVIFRWIKNKFYKKGVLAMNKFEELILEICRQSENDEYCGATKLNKILFYIDFFAYQNLGQPISGQTYRKLDYGPVPKNILRVLRTMESNGDIKKVETTIYNKKQNRTVALRLPDLSVFSKKERDLITSVIKWLRQEKAITVSDLSHKYIGWKLAEMNEDIPYETVFISDRKLTSEEKDYAYVLAELPEYKRCYV
jgi:hypothetical protein